MSVGCGVITTFFSEGTTSIAYDASGTQIVALQREPEDADATCTGPEDFVFPDCNTTVLVSSSSCH